MKITTNNVPRNVIYFYELTQAERSEFDYLGETDALVRYKGELIALADFTRVAKRSQPGNSMAHVVDDDSPLLAWHGIRMDTYFSGVAIRFADTDGERVILGSVSA